VGLSNFGNIKLNNGKIFKKFNIEVTYQKLDRQRKTQPMLQKIVVQSFMLSVAFSIVMLSFMAPK
jgi:hypothetical protein